MHSAKPDVLDKIVCGHNRTLWLKRTLFPVQNDFALESIHYSVTLPTSYATQKLYYFI